MKVEIENLRIAVLVLAHKNSTQVEKLLKILTLKFDVYLHIDAKSNLETNEFAIFQNVTVIKSRKISWGSFSMVQATLDLLQLAHARKYDRYILISGQDLPTKTPEQISEFFERVPDLEFVEGLNLKDWDKGGLDRISLFHGPSPVGALGLRKFLLQLFDFASMKVQKYFRVHRKTAWDFYCGPQWVDLTGFAAERILQLVESAPDFLRRFKFTSCADEIFFPTALHYLGIEDRIANQTLRFIDWESGPEYPRILRVEDISRLDNGSHIFARKFDEKVDRRAIDAVCGKFPV